MEKTNAFFRLVPNNKTMNKTNISKENTIKTIDNLMNRLKYCILLIVLFSSIFSNSLTAQTSTAKDIANISWGNPLKEPAGSFLTKIIGSSSEGFYALRRNDPEAFLSNGTHKIILEYYDERMQLKKSRESALKFKNKKLEFENVFMLNGQLYLFSSFNNEAKKKNYLFVQEISSKSLTPRNKLRMISEIETRNKVKEGAFSFEFSGDSSKVLIYSQLPYKKKQPERFALRVYDPNFELEWEKDITLPFNDEFFEVADYQVDNQGNVYLLGIIYEGNGRRGIKDGAVTYKYSILVYRADGSPMEEYKIDLDDKLITDMTFRVAKNGHLVCAGFYSLKNTYSAKGTCFLRLNPQTQEVYNVSFKPFDFDFLTAYDSDRKRRKYKDAEERNDNRRAPELFRYSLDELILRSDGGVLLVAEQYFVEEINRTDPYAFGYYNYYNRSYRQDYIYYYNDIIVVNIQPDGEVEWVSRIPKQQISQNDGGYFSSYAMSIVRDKIFFVFNDDYRNFDANRKRRKNNFTGRASVITIGEVRKDGEVRIMPLFNNNEADVITRPKVCKQVGKREMIVFGERGRNNRFALLEFL